VNALNCRKSAILSQLLLRHKLIVLGGLDLTRQETKVLFGDLIVKYARIFLTTQTLVFDLAPFLQYLPECGSAEEQSEVLSMFDAEIEQAGED
jgi:hypothetical protein